METQGVARGGADGSTAECALAGKTVDRRYVIKRQIARGRGATLYEAQHAHTRATVALKVADRPAGRGRKVKSAPVIDEARTLAQLRHPGAVALFDAGICLEHGAYAAMEMLRGRTLDALLAARGRIEVRDAVHLGRQLCEVLGFAHGRGVIHRAVCPGNVFVGRDEQGDEVVKLLGFGGDATAGTARELADYLAPDAREGADAGPRGDVYAVGMVLYAALTGAPATRADDHRVLRAARPDAPAALCAAITHALARNPGERPATPAVLARALADATGIHAGHSSLLDDDPRHAGEWLRAEDVSMLGENDDGQSLALPPGQRVPAGAVPPRLPTAADAPQRRRFARAPYITPVRIVTANDEAFEGRSGDVSEGGVQVIAGRLLAVGERVHLRFALPTTGAVTTVPATVQWAREGHGRVAMGFEFLAVPPGTHAAVAEYVALMVPAEG